LARTLVVTFDWQFTFAAPYKHFDNVLVALLDAEEGPECGRRGVNCAKNVQISVRSGGNEWCP